MSFLMKETASELIQRKVPVIILEGITGYLVVSEESPLIELGKFERFHEAEEFCLASGLPIVEEINEDGA